MSPTFQSSIGLGPPRACGTQCDKEASQTRDYCFAKYATLRLRSGQATRAAHPDPSLRLKNGCVRDDHQSVPRAWRWSGGTLNLFMNYIYGINAVAEALKARG